MNLQHQLDSTAGANGSTKRRKQVYWGKNKNNSMIIHKIERWPQATNPITSTTNKNYNNHQGRSPTVPTTAA